MKRETAISLQITGVVGLAGSVLQAFYFSGWTPLWVAAYLGLLGAVSLLLIVLPPIHVRRGDSQSK